MKINSELKRLITQYQEFTPTTALYPDSGKGTDIELFYLFCGLLGEEQEWIQSNYDTKEAGDVLWYCSQLCNYLDFPLVLLFTFCKPDQGSPRPNIHESVKKYLRDGKEFRPALLDYMTLLLGFIVYRYHYSVNNPDIEETLKEIIIGNRDKLIDRQNRNMIKGDGDAR